MALKARSSPSPVRTTIAGLLPNLKMIPLFGLRAAARPATAAAAADSPLAGGTRKRATGYSIAAAVETKPTLSTRSSKDRRSKRPDVGSAGPTTSCGCVDIAAIGRDREQGRGQLSRWAGRRKPASARNRAVPCGPIGRGAAGNPAQGLAPPLLNICSTAVRARVPGVAASHGSVLWEVSFDGSAHLDDAGHE